MSVNTLTNSLAAPYGNDNAILLQLALVAFIENFQVTTKIKSLTTNENCCTDNILPLFNFLVNEHTTFPILFFSSINHNNSLKKLKIYCEQIVNNIGYENFVYQNLYNIVSQLVLSVLHIIELFKEKQLLKNSKINSYGQTEFSLFWNYFNQLTIFFPKIFHGYWDNENVIFCLMRHKEILIEIYGKDFLKQHFASPFSIQQILTLLLERYSKRGFESVLPSIRQHCNF